MTYHLKIFSHFLSVFFLYCLLSINTCSAVAFNITDGSVVLNNELKVLYDNEQLFDIEEARQNLPYQSGLDDGVINLHFSIGTVWMSSWFSHNSSKLETLVFELQNNKSLDVDYYLYTKNGTLLDSKNYHASNNQQIRPLTGTYYEFILEPNTEVQLVIKLTRVNSGTRPVLWSKQAFENKQMWLLPIVGAYIGVLLALALYHLIVYTSSRQLSYIWFSAYTITCLFWSNLFTGFASLFLPTEIYRLLDPHADSLVILAFAFAGLFCYQFSDLRKQSALVLKWLHSIIAISILLAVLTMLLEQRTTLMIIALVTLLAAPSYVYISFKSWQDKQKGSWYYLLSWLPIFAVCIYTQLSIWHFIPASEYRSLVLNGAVLLQILLMSLAVTEKLRASEQEKDFLLNHDNLTKLPNRHYIIEHLNLYAKNRQLTLLQIEIRRLNEIQNTLGMETADQILLTIANRLKHWSHNHELTIALERSDLPTIKVGYLMRGRFLISLKGTLQDENLPSIVDELRELIHQPLEYKSLTLECNAYIGIIRSAYHGNDIHYLLQNVNIAANLACKKQLPFTLYSDDKNLYTERRLALASDLKKALLESSELFLCLQPQIELATGKTIGAEALIRWQHKDHGTISPMEFIPIAEESGLITQITYWAIKEALNINELINHERPGHKISVNISAYDLESPTFINVLTGLLADSTLDNNQLLLEVTESAMMNELGKAHLTLEQIHDLGVRTSIDDFGTGYSSLSYLSLLPVNEIKIDKSFVINMLDYEQNYKITENILNLSRSLHLDTVAEGIEDLASQQALAKLGCKYGQGYYISKPLIVSDYIEWLTLNPTPK